MKKYIETVGELIQELQKYPQDMRVFDFNGDEIEKVTYCEEIYLGDPANPKCKVTDGLKIE